MVILLSQKYYKLAFDQMKLNSRFNNERERNCYDCNFIYSLNYYTTTFSYN